MTRSRCVREPLRKIFGSNIYEAQTSLHLVDYKKKVGGEAKKSENTWAGLLSGATQQQIKPCSRNTSLGRKLPHLRWGQCFPLSCIIIFNFGK